MPRPRCTRCIFLKDVSPNPPDPPSYFDRSLLCPSSPSFSLVRSFEIRSAAGGLRSARTIFFFSLPLSSQCLSAFCSLGRPRCARCESRRGAARRDGRVRGITYVSLRTSLALNTPGFPSSFPVPRLLGARNCLRPRLLFSTPFTPPTNDNSVQSA